MTEYLVQSILVDNSGRYEIEMVVDSFRTTDYEMMLEFLMKKHRSSKSYLYVVMEIETQKVVYKSKENKYAF